MPEKTGNFRLVLQIGLALAVLAVGISAAAVALRPMARVETVIRNKAVDQVPGSVVVYADGNMKELKSQAHGIVAWCEALDPTKSFKQGDVLVRLDTTDLDREIEQAKRDYETAQQRLRVLFANVPEWTAARQKLDEAIKQGGGKASDEVARLQSELDAIASKNDPGRIAASEALAEAKQLLAAGHGTAEAVKQAERVLEANDTRLRLAHFEARNARAAHELFLKNKEIERQRMSIKAPFDGAVKDALVWQGALISSGSTVATIYSNARIVVAKISEEDIGRVKPDQMGRVRLLAFPSEEFDAKVLKILPTADENTQRYTVYLEVAVDPAKLIPFSTGEVTIVVGEHENQPLIPRRALFNDSNVLVVKDGQVEKRQIKVGFVGMNIVEAREGLAPGEQVIVEELDRFRHGQRVRLVTGK